jgi:hypothetical protein
MNGGVVGVFIAPTTKLDRWLGCLLDGAPDSPTTTYIAFYDEYLMTMNIFVIGYFVL